MILQEDAMDILDWGSLFEPFLVLFVLIILMGLMILIYTKLRIWVISLVIFLFSLIFGMMSISYEFLPFTPYLSIFFLLFQTVFFLLISMEMFKV